MRYGITDPISLRRPTFVTGPWRGRVCRPLPSSAMRAPLRSALGWAASSGPHPQPYGPSLWPVLGGAQAAGTCFGSRLGHRGGRSLAGPRLLALASAAVWATGATGAWRGPGCRHLLRQPSGPPGRPVLGAAQIDLPRQPTGATCPCHGRESGTCVGSSLGRTCGRYWVGPGMQAAASAALRATPPSLGKTFD